MTTTAEKKPGEKKAAKKAARASAEARQAHVDVTAVIGQIDQGEALRDRIKTLTAELKACEDLIKDVLGEASVGVDSKGHVLVRFPYRNRSGLSKERVKDLLTPDQYAQCEQVTEYRTLLYGES